MHPVLLLSGPGRSARSLRPLADRLADLGHTVHVHALPDQHPGPLPVLTAPAVVVGVAGGHRAALALAAAHPAQVHRLVLVSPSPGGRPLGRHVARVVATSLREVPSLKPQLLRENLRPGLRRRVEALRAALAEPLDPAALPVPIVVVVGDRDGSVPRESARALGGQLVVVEGGAHELHWSAPHLLARLVDRVARDPEPTVPRLGADDPLAPPRRVPTAVHAALDVVGVALALGVPRARGWSRPTTAVLTAAAAAEVVATLLTEHPTGLVRRLPVPLHLNLDSGGGLLLLAASVTLLRGAPRHERLATAALGLAGVVLADLSSAPVGPARLDDRP